MCVKLGNVDDVVNKLQSKSTSPNNLKTIFDEITNEFNERGFKFNLLTDLNHPLFRITGKIAIMLNCEHKLIEFTISDVTTRINKETDWNERDQIKSIIYDIITESIERC